MDFRGPASGKDEAFVFRPIAGESQTNVRKQLKNRENAARPPI